MDLRILRYFLVVAREESITKAAQALHITQPTLSRQIAQMEEEMGVKLLDRQARRVSLTEEGLLLRRRGEEILELVEKTEQELIQQDEKVEGTVSVGCGDLAAVQMLPPLFQTFQARYPAVQFELYTATADHIKDRMDRGLTDVGLLLEPAHIEKYEFIRLNQQEEWIVVMHPDSPLAALERIAPKDLMGLPLILPHRLDVQGELAGWFGDVFDKLNVAFTANLTANISALVYHKLAYAVAIRGSNSFWDPQKIVCRPLQPPLTATSVLAWKRMQPFGLAAAKFIQYAKETLRPQQDTKGEPE